ncbi:MAG: ATP-dependent DNA helicase RecG, partial [Pseudoalteromonas distincta]
MSKPSLNQYPITELKGVGPKMAERLLKLGILTVQDMLFHLPLRYEDRTRLYAINELSLQSHVSVEATIETSQITFGKRRMLVCQINDGTGRLTLRFFNFTAAQKNAFSAGKIIRCFGEVRRGRVGFEMSHPEYSISDTSNEQPVATTLTPVYSTTEGLKQLSIRALSEQAIDLLNKYSVEELLPSQWQPSNMPLSDALLLLHRPPNDVDVTALEQGTHPAQQRLVFEELLAQNLSLLKVREQGQQVKAVALNPVNTLESQFLEQLPFAPTNAQSRVVAEIKGDMQHAYPMMRLVQGDVGSGKTLVAALSALTAIAQGFQVA